MDRAGCNQQPRATGSRQERHRVMVMWRIQTEGSIHGIALGVTSSQELQGAGRRGTGLWQCGGGKLMEICQASSLV